MTWVWIACVLALLPLGSRRSLRLASLAQRPVVDRPALVDRSLDPALIAGVTWPASVVVGALVTLRSGSALGVSAGLALATGLSLWVAALRRRAALGQSREVALAAQVVIAEVEAGAEPAAALDAAAQSSGLGAELSALGSALRQARDPTTDVSPGLAPMAHALRVSSVTGAPAAAVLGILQRQAEAVLDQGRAVASALAGTRSSAMLLALLPVAGLLLGAGLGASPLAVLLDSGLGHALVLVGVGLECAGLWWTARLAAWAEDTPP